MATASPTEYILLPERGVRARPGQPLFVGSLVTRSTEEPVTVAFGWPSGRGLSEGVEFEFQPPSPRLPTGFTRVEMQVVDSIHEDAPKLVRLTDDAALALRREAPAVRLAPIRRYSPMEEDVSLSIAPPPGAGESPPFIICVQSALTGAPVTGVEVIALVDAGHRLGDRGITDQEGRVYLRLGDAARAIEKLYVEPPPKGLWGAFQRQVDRTGTEHLVKLEPVDHMFREFKDALRHFYGLRTPKDAGRRVRVAVIDSGVDTAHPDLSIALGRNTVTGEPASNFGDNGLGHGTHVAGIIAARGRTRKGMSGLAPNVELHVFRVFGEGSSDATNYAIAKALIYACDEECHLINLSLGATPPDQVLEESIEDARDRGALVISAAGNAGRKPVAVPACYGLAVSALGRKETFPAGAREEADLAAPAGSDPANFVAGFSNVGADVDFIAPGVGIVSTVPGGYSPKRGTSMAAAAATGVAARLLSAQPNLLGMAADKARSTAMQGFLNERARSRGFGLTFEGYGML